MVRTEVATALERQIGEHFGVGEVVLLGRASLGLMLVLKSWLLHHGAVKVALSPIVCQDVVAAVIESGCSAYFVDVDPTSGLVADTEWERARLDGCSVAIVVHLYGNGSDVRGVERIFAGSDCLVIDDAAQAFGTTVNGELAGSMGDIGLLSFGRTKQISTGGAAILLKDDEAAFELRTALSQLVLSDRAEVTMAQIRFQRRLGRARKSVRHRGSADAFKGIIGDYTQTLYRPVPPEMMAALPPALDDFPKIAEERQTKARIWRDVLHGSALKPIAVDPAAVPWRYASRLLGATWMSQHKLGDLIRARGVEVSHWYLPGHWLVSGGSVELPGAETISREAFQFWVDDSVTVDQVAEQAADVRDILDRETAL